MKTDVVNDKNGKTLTEEMDIKQRWAEYCRDLYSSREPGQRDNRQVEEDREPPPLRSEVEWSLNHIDNGKSPGMDNIPIEVWKATGEIGIDLL